MSIRLYVGNLPKEEVDRQELQAVFGGESDSITTKVIKDRKTGQCRGFAFVTVKTDELADELIEKFNGFMFKDSPLKIEKALPRTKNESEDEARPAPEKPTKATGEAKAAPTAGGSGGGSRRGGKQKSRRAQGERATTTTTDSEAIQPDPRWATDLLKLKELLLAQTSNS